MDDCQLTSGQTTTSQLKIDDDDGHYIVNPDTDLGDRCEYLNYLDFQCHRVFGIVTDLLQIKSLDYWVRAHSER